MLPDMTVPADFEFDAVVVDDTRVDDRGDLPDDVGEPDLVICRERGEDVVAVLLEDIEREGQPLVEELGVDT